MFIYVGQDDITSIPVGRTFPIAASSHQSARDIIPMGKEVCIADHDWRAEKIVPSVTHQMNFTNIAVDSLFSGGESRNDLVYVSIHATKLDKSSGMKHATNLYNIKMMEACKALSDFTNKIYKAYTLFCID